MITWIWDGLTVKIVNQDSKLLLEDGDLGVDDGGCTGEGREKKIILCVVYIIRSDRTT